MSTVKTFKAKVTDEDDWPYPEAFVAVRQWSQSAQETGNSSDCKEDYTEEYAVEAIAYRANYWPDSEVQAKGLKSKPLINQENTEEPQLFTVDLNHLQSLQVLNSSMSPADKRFRLIELDVTRRFA